MAKIGQLIKKHSRQLSQTALLCLFILVITCFMPRERKTIYDFEEGAPWKHEQLIAEFSFDVQKPEEAMLAEKEKLRKATMPYFIHDPATADSMCKRFEEGLNKRFLFNIYKNTFGAYAGKLRELYDKGIVSDDDAKFLTSNRYVMCMDGDRQVKKESAGFVSESEARKIIGTLDTELISDTLVAGVITSNYSYDPLLTEAAVEREFDKIDTGLASVQKGQRIISYGDVVDNEKFCIISTYLDEVDKLEEKESGIDRNQILFGQILFVVIVMFLMYCYMELYQPEVVHNAYKFIFSVLIVSVFPIVVGLMQAFGYSNIFILPFAIVPMMMCLFVNSQAAIVVHTATVLICSVMLPEQYEFTLLQITAGYSVILSLKELSSRSQMFRCVLIAFATYSLVYLCHSLLSDSGSTYGDYSMYIQFAISSLLTLIAYPIMIVFEKTFHFVSNVTLIELSNLNAHLLQKLSQDAPGTFQHSIQVSNLAAEAAHAIGANSLLVRTGALYHDIGKTENPIYFTENQSGGVNPHNSLSYIESAQTIKKHVTDGLEIARHAGLPKSIQEFIATHHGLSKTGWFYISYKNEHPGEEIDESLFMYPGPKPATKEQAILMMADCTEAASHSIKDYTEENISETVDNVIGKLLNDQQLSLAPLTFQDIDTIKGVFKKRLMAIYHTRISYPKENTATTESKQE